MTKRNGKTTKYLRYAFSEDERLSMGKDLAEAHNKIADIDSEEAVMKAQIKERRTAQECIVATLSRNIFNGFDMRTLPCAIKWDSPKTGECEYYREDTGELVEQRAMTSDERQMELELDTKPAV